MPKKDAGGLVWRDRVFRGVIAFRTKLGSHTELCTQLCFLGEKKKPHTQKPSSQ